MAEQTASAASSAEDPDPEADQDMAAAVEVDDASLALEGITMLLNNDWNQAEELFAKHKEDSLTMCSGYSFVAFMQAIMSFEDDKVKKALKILQETEKRCEANGNFVKDLKRKMKKKMTKTQAELESKLQKQIILGDSLIYQAVLTFINFDLTSYIKGGWLLRKSWKVYDRTYRTISTMHDSLPPSASVPNELSEALGSVSVGEEAGEVIVQQEQLRLSRSISSTASYNSTDDTVDLGGALPRITVERLLAAVSFGYGAFQLCISMMPPKVLKIIEFLGFEGDRNLGLQCIEHSSKSQDMKAPLASLGLLWYHTVIRPFFALDGGNVDAGVDDAMALIDVCEKKYPKSSLFLFFKARALRLRSEIDESLKTYTEALDGCAGQREIELICLHEIGWLNLMKAQWKDAADCFSKLKNDSKWSKSYYGYLSAMCVGAAGDVAAAEEILKEVPSLVKKKRNQIEQFVLKRVEKFKKTPVTKEHCVLRLLEVLYLWNAYPTVMKDDLKRMLEELSQLKDKDLFHLQSLCEATIYRELGDDETAKTFFQEAIVRQEGKKEDLHVTAYAMYELGNMLARHPETHAAGKKYLETVRDKMKDYDFENRLDVRVHAALKRISINPCTT